MTVPIRPDGLRPITLQETRGIPLGNEPTTGPSFKDTLANALNDVTATQTEAQDIISSYVRGEPVELHEVMAASEEAAISLELLVQMRNKITEAYRTIMNMQT